jgi:recombination protein RecR
MKDNNSEISKLIYLFSKLPGLGQRSARRIVLHLLQDPEVRLKGLIALLQNTADKVVQCSVCGNLDDISPCSICSDQTRMHDIIAIVETVSDLWAMERSGVYRGYYHVLGGTLNAARGTSPENLKLPLLLKRCMNGEIQEIIIATNSTVEGQTTAFFITEYLKDYNFRISRLASGIPVGGELDYLDEGTLSAALSLRQPFNS